jgi:hypothetical protein
MLGVKDPSGAKDSGTANTHFDTSESIGHLYEF